MDRPTKIRFLHGLMAYHEMRKLYKQGYSVEEVISKMGISGKRFKEMAKHVCSGGKLYGILGR